MVSLPNLLSVSRSSRAVSESSRLTGVPRRLLPRVVMRHGSQSAFLEALDFGGSDGHGNLHGLMQLLVSGPLLSCNCKTILSSGLATCRQRSPQGNQVFGLGIDHPVSIDSGKKILILRECIGHCGSSSILVPALRHSLKASMAGAYHFPVRNKGILSPGSHGDVWG